MSDVEIVSGQIDRSSLSFGTFIANLQLGAAKSSKTIFAMPSIFASDPLKPTGYAGIFGVVAVKPVGRSIPHPLQPHGGVGKSAMKMARAYLASIVGALPEKHRTHRMARCPILRSPPFAPLLSCLFRREWSIERASWRVQRRWLSRLHILKPGDTPFIL